MPFLCSLCFSVLSDAGRFYCERDGIFRPNDKGAFVWNGPAVGAEQLALQVILSLLN